MYLIILNGKQEGQCVDLTCGTHIIGRGDGAHIKISGDRFMSGKHAELILSDIGVMQIRDKGSKNGTFLLGERVQEERSVSCGDIIQVGKTFIKVTRNTSDRLFPSGDHAEVRTESIMVVDIVGSSKIANLMGDHAAGKVKSVLSMKLKNLHARFPADYVKSTGDGFLLTFAKPLTAIRLSIELIRSIVKDTSGNGILLRVGINYGETMVLADGDRQGAAVDMAFRVESARIDTMHQTTVGIQKEDVPRTNRIFVTESIHRFISASSTVKTRCIGFFDLKGFTGRHKIFEVMI